MIEETIDWLIENLEEIKKALKRIEERKKKIKLNKLMLELYRMNALTKIRIEDLDYVRSHYVKKNKKEVMWIIECEATFLNDRN